MGKLELFTGGAKTTQQQSVCTPCHHLIRGPLIQWDTTDTLSREERLKRLKMRIERSTAIVSRSKLFCVHKTRKLVELFRVQQPWQDVTMSRAVLEAVLVVGSLSFVPTLWFLIYTYWPDQEDYLHWPLTPEIFLYLRGCPYITSAAITRQGQSECLRTLTLQGFIQKLMSYKNPH